MSSSSTLAETGGSRAVTPSGREAMSRAAQQILLIVLPILVTAAELSITLGLHNLAIDFHGWYWPAGHRVLMGSSPYTVPPAVALNYPAFGALVFVPFALIPLGAAEILFLLLVVASVPVTLFLLGIRDWRAYAVVALWEPVVVGWETANITLLVVCGLALIWRFRDRAPVAGLVLAALISIKIFLFPVAIWMLATRRFTALAWACAGTIALNLISWAVVGLDQITVYYHVLKAFGNVAELRGYSLIGLMLHVGASRMLAEAIGLGAAALAIGASLRMSGPARDRVVFTATIAACLWASPVVESHYIALLLVPVALAAPVLSWPWLLPVVLFILPADHPALWQHALDVGVTVLLVLGCIWWVPRRRSSARPAPAVS